MTIWRMPVSLTGTVPGGPFINVWHFRLSSTPVADGSIGKVISELRAFYTGLIFSVPNIGPTLGPGLSITAEFATNTETQEQIPVTWAPMPTGSAGTVAPNTPRTGRQLEDHHRSSPSPWAYLHWASEQG